MRNILLEIAYDGTGYFGWQKNRGSLTIEGELQKCLERFFQEPIQLQASSRTDAGVHAHGQLVNFFTSHEDLCLKLLKRSLNGMLSRQIVVKKIEFACASFHPTLDIEGKKYEYWICNSPIQQPFNRLFSWHIPLELDVEEMVKASKYLEGTHDFSALCNTKKNEDYEDHERTIQVVEVTEHPGRRLSISVTGNRFLYKMVRNIVGLLVYVGLGKVLKEEIPSILKKKDRKLSGITAPAHGLTLMNIISSS